MWDKFGRNCQRFRIGGFLVQTPLGARMGLGTQPHYETPADLQVKYAKCK